MTEKAEAEAADGIATTCHSSNVCRIGADWLRKGFDEWPEEANADASAPCPLASESSSPYKVVIRFRTPRTAWERFCQRVVGEFVHVDTVLAEKGTDGAKVCFSSYMHDVFRMHIMDHALMFDANLSNLALDVTEEEHARCAKFMHALDGRASYSYVDAMVLMPMAPKPYANSNIVTSAQRAYSDFFNTLVSENAEDATNPMHIKKVFCSQSVVLMLRYGLDPDGKHKALVKTLHQMNSRLVSPLQVHSILQAHGSQSISNEQLAAL